MRHGATIAGTLAMKAGVKICPACAADACAAVRQDGLMLSLPIEAVERIFALGFALDQLRQHLRDLDRCVREAARMR